MIARTKKEAKWMMKDEDKNARTIFNMMNKNNSANIIEQNEKGRGTDEGTNEGR